MENQEEAISNADKKSGKLMLFSKNGKLQIVLRICITVLFVFIVNRSIKSKEIESLLGKVNLWGIGLSLLLGAAGVYLQACRWRIVLHSQKLPSTNKVAYKTLLWGNLLAFITPGRIGELFRGLHLDKKRKALSVLAVITDQIFAIAVTLIFGFAAVFIELIFFRRVPHPGFVFPLIFLAISVLFLAYLHRFSGILAKVALLKPVISSLSSFYKGMKNLKLSQMIFISFLVHVSLILQTSILLYMFGSISIWKNCIIAMQSYAFMIFLPFFIANIGLREYSFALFLKEMERYGATQVSIPVASLGVSIMILLINIVLPALIGLVWTIMDRERVA